MEKFRNFYTDVYGLFVLKKNVSKKRMIKIFTLFRVDSTFKTTSYDRMKDMNIKLKKYILKYFSKKILVCDFGISSGQTTLELFNDLSEIKIENIYGFDKQIYLKVYRIKNLIFLYSSENKLLMAEYNKHCLRYRYFFLFKKIQKPMLYILNLLNVRCENSTVLVPNLDKIDKCKFFEQDVFNVNKKYFNSFDVVRVSNLLNNAYFSKMKLKIAVLNINKISKENCIVLINRTTKKKVDTASFFIKKNGKFKLLEDINGGSEIKDLMLSC